MEVLFCLQTKLNPLICNLVVDGLDIIFKRFPWIFLAVVDRIEGILYMTFGKITARDLRHNFHPVHLVVQGRFSNACMFAVATRPATPRIFSTSTP